MTQQNTALEPEDEPGDELPVFRDPEAENVAASADAIASMHNKLATSAPDPRVAGALAAQQDAERLVAEAEGVDYDELQRQAQQEDGDGVSARAALEGIAKRALAHAAALVDAEDPELAAEADREMDDLEQERIDNTVTLDVGDRILAAHGYDVLAGNVRQHAAGLAGVTLEGYDALLSGLAKGKAAALAAGDNAAADQMENEVRIFRAARHFAKEAGKIREAAQARARLRV